MSSDSETDTDIECTPPNLRAEAKLITENILPAKSKERYIKTYDQFVTRKSEQKAHTFSESVLLANFNYLAKSKQPSSLWTIYSMLQCTIQIKHDVDIKEYNCFYLPKQFFISSHFLRKALYKPFTFILNMNNTITVSTLFPCNTHFYEEPELIFNPSWRHNMIGCCIIHILQNMYNLSINYVVESPFMDSGDIDLYANPMSMGPEILDIAKPVHTVVLWRLGFILRHPHGFRIFLRYYSKPFSRPVWNCLYGMLIIVTLLFYILSWFEKRYMRAQFECSFGLELLLAIGGYCQHIFPVEAIFNSRRTAHFTFFLYCYIIYTFYTSNLLSHLVSDKENDIQLEDLSASDYDISILDSMRDIYNNNYTFYSSRANLTDVIWSKLSNARFVSLPTAVESIRLEKTALLSDYISVYPGLMKAFSNDEICQLSEIDLLPEVRKYLFSSKRFRFREQLVLGTLRAKEAGVLQRLISFDKYQPLDCQAQGQHVVEISQIYTPLLYLASTYVIASVIMFCERWRYRRNLVWPYVE